MTRRKRQLFTAADDQVIRERYPTTLTRDIAKDIGHPESSVYKRARVLGLKKDPAFLSSAASGRLQQNHGIGVRTRFKPGNESWNKGQNYRPGGFSTAFQFKPGHKPYTWVPVGTTLIDGDGYTKRKVRDDAPPGKSRRNWVFVHRELWEQHNGPVPAGHNVTFVNGNKSDIRIENLELVSRVEWMRRYSVQNLPEPVRQVVQLRGAIVRQINKRSRQNGK
jgi:hypothetical protein